MKHVLQIPAHLYTGGVEKVARDIGIYADKSKYQVDYIVFDKEVGNYEAELEACGSRIFHIDEPSLSYPRFLKNLKMIMIQTQYDIVHAHTMFNIGLIMLVARQMKVPVRISHAHSALIRKKSWKVAVYEGLMGFLIRHCSTDFVACGRAAGCRLYGNRLFARKGQLILNGIDTKRFAYDEKNRSMIRQALDLDDHLLIGHVGHLLEVKNQQYLIGLMPEIIKINPKARLILLGDGPDRTRLKDLVKKAGLEEYVIMTGNVSNVNQFLSAMDVFVFPSLYEGMPLSLLEVQANGLPCVLSEHVPGDVYITDLLHCVRLEDKAGWIKGIRNLHRYHSETYEAALSDQGFDSFTALRKFYALYDRA